MSAGRALVAGGGIAGMAAALALARSGWEVALYERRPELGEVGAGLQMAPNASRVLQWLGVLDRVRETAVAPERAQLLDGVTGTPIYAAALGETAVERWGAPYLHIHRVDLLAALTEAAREAGVAIHLGRAATGFLNRGKDIVLHLENGERPSGALLIGADGIGSALRSKLNSDEEPRYSGQVAWRALVPASALPPELVPRAATVWTGSQRHVVTYYLRGGDLVNLVAVEERGEWTAEGWSEPGDPDRLRASFTGWHEAPAAVLNAVTDCFQWGLFDRPAQVRWAEGRLCLIGDAAHPMLPFMASGAAMGLEDAAMLALKVAPCRENGAAIDEALHDWEDARWSRVTRVQEAARANGRLFHLRPGPLRALARAPIRMATRVAPDFAAGRLDWLYGFDATR